MSAIYFGESKSNKYSILKRNETEFGYLTQVRHCSGQDCPDFETRFKLCKTQTTCPTGSTQVQTKGKSELNHHGLALLPFEKR